MHFVLGFVSRIGVHPQLRLLYGNGKVKHLNFFFKFSQEELDSLLMPPPGVTPARHVMSAAVTSPGLGLKDTIQDYLVSTPESEKGTRGCYSFVLRWHLHQPHSGRYPCHFGRFRSSLGDSPLYHLLSNYHTPYLLFTFIIHYSLFMGHSSLSSLLCIFLEFLD